MLLWQKLGQCISIF